jgi:hypothetical protein
MRHISFIVHGNKEHKMKKPATKGKDRKQNTGGANDEDGNKQKNADYQAFMKQQLQERRNIRYEEGEE